MPRRIITMKEAEEVIHRASVLEHDRMYLSSFLKDTVSNHGLMQAVKAMGVMPSLKQTAKKKLAEVNNELLKLGVQLEYTTEDADDEEREAIENVQGN